MAWTILLYSAIFFRFKNWCKITFQKKVLWHRCWPALARGSNCNFCQKNAFFGQQKAFFQKVHFIQKCSVTQHKVFQYVKKIFFWSNPKFKFFTKFNLNIKDYIKSYRHHFTFIFDKSFSTNFNRQYFTFLNFFIKIQYFGTKIVIKKIINFIVLYPKKYI